MKTVLEVVNRTAQNLLETAAAEQWFAELEPGERLSALHQIVAAIEQAHPRPGEVERAIVESGLRPAFTPCVLLRAHPLPEAFARVAGLPPDEHIKAFRLLLQLFTVADARRRRDECRGTCSHEWHHLE